MISAVVWQRMLKILGDVNSIPDAAMHHLAFQTLLNVWRRLVEVREREREGGGGGRKWEGRTEGGEKGEREGRRERGKEREGEKEREKERGKTATREEVGKG